VARRIAAQERGEGHQVLGLAKPPTRITGGDPVNIRVVHGSPHARQGEFNPYADPSLAAEVLTAVYFDTLSRWLTEAEPPFDLSGGLADKLDLVLAGLTVPQSCES
jgi:hypothetical protein